MVNDIAKRLIVIRESLGISQEELGHKIGISRFSISNYESGKRNVTERVVKDICREFNIDYRWLKTGEGEMLHISADPVVDRINDLLEGENETAKTVFRAFASFNESDWQTVKKFIEALKKDEAD